MAENAGEMGERLRQEVRERSSDKAAFDEMNKMFPSDLTVDAIVSKEESISAKHDKENAAILAAKEFYIRNKIASILAEMKELGIESLESPDACDVTILDVNETNISEIKLIPKRF